MASAASVPLPWSCALVTGASSGIGEAMARRLAEAGVPALVVVARRRERLEALATDLADRHGTAVEVLAADLRRPDERAAVEDRLLAGAPSATSGAGPGAGGSRNERPPVDLLVNNAGAGTPGTFLEAGVDALEAQVELNVVAPVRLAHAAAPAMVARGRGAICNVSSLASFQPTPGSAVYAAGKAFVTSFSESLHEELRGTGVTVTAVCPGFVRTEFLGATGPSGERAADAVPRFAWMSAEAVATEALAATARGRALCVPGLGYRVLATLEAPVPRGARRWLMGRLSASAGASVRRRPIGPTTSAEPAGRPHDDPRG